MIDWILSRLREPSTYAGLSGFAIALGFTDGQWVTISTAIAGVAGVIAMLLSERKPQA